MPEKYYRTRPWTFLQGEDYFGSRRKKNKVHTPKINTYNNQFDKCQKMYERLKLDESSSGQPILPRLHTSVEFTSSGGIQYSTKSAPATVFPERQLSIHRHVPARQFSIHRPVRAWHYHDGQHNDNMDEHELGSISSSNVSTSKKRYMDPIRLSQHLIDHGFGLPLTLPSGDEEFIPNYRRRPLKSRGLPKNPSQREKIKGRARLDYEMANLRALAFCAQQNTTKMFRTASANMRNRDVQFVDDEVRDRLHRDEVEDVDDTASIVVMAMNREELFQKVDTWMNEVDRAFKGVT